MFGYIYESIDKRNKMIYIGKREQRVFDPDYHGSGKIVLNILKKYGNDIFITRKIDQIDEEDEKRLKEREKDYIKAYRIFYGEDKLYNIADGGDGGATTRGRKFTFTKEHCANIGKTRLGKSSWSKGLTKETDERVANLSKILTGKHRVEGFGETGNL